MWTLAIFLFTGGQAHLTQTDDLATCLAAYQSQIASSVIAASNVERAMCTSPNGRIVQWIVKPTR